MMVSPYWLFQSPDLFKESVPAQFPPALVPVLRKLLLDRQLRGDARMVLSRLPERVKAAHPVPARQDVLERVVEGVSHVERPGHVGGRDHDAEALCPVPRIGAGPESAGRFPLLVDSRLGRRCVEGFLQGHGPPPSMVRWAF